MCYSAMVEQNAKKYGVRFKARIQNDLYLDLFQQRLNGSKIYVNKAMESQFVTGAESAEAIEAGRLITAWHEQQIPILERELFAQKKRLADATRQLETKVTKKAENEKRIAANKIEKLKRDIVNHQSVEVRSESDQRIFPLHYMSIVCLDNDGQKVVRPVRYLLRPHDKPADFDVKFNGCYNARLDSLESVAWWKDCFGKRHGLVLVKKFYENVEARRYSASNDLPAGSGDREKLVLCFEPENFEFMVIPVLWDLWKGEGGTLYSAAIITDEPAPEIARAGHDRTPIFLDESVADEWLMAQGKSTAELRAVLAKRQRPHYSHRILGAA